MGMATGLDYNARCNIIDSFTVSRQVVAQKHNTEGQFRNQVEMLQESGLTMQSHVASNNPVIERNL